MTASSYKPTSTTVPRSDRVLQLNSTVVSGFAGAKSSTFPMQVLGLDVDCLYTTQHSNHSGYDHVSKADFANATLKNLFEGLSKNDLLQNRYDYFFTGFVSDEEFLQYMIEMYKKLKAENPNILWFCDTVIGDKNKHTGEDIYYCPKELVPLYRDCVLQYANVITPNQLELELLAQTSIRTRQEALDAMRHLHEAHSGLSVIILTSVDTEFGSEMLVSSSNHDANQALTIHYHQASFEEQPFHFTGTGDCMMGLLIGNLHNNDLQVACANALSSMQAILQNSVKAIQDGCNPFGELKIVQSMAEITNPPRTHQVVPL
ncbi:Pyridoxal kinase [Seminavis robusta]|uniref:pyridoxal kinase n=1 Tax=Seminavis robusta TaxID=568900 RepID=A0A9N8DYT2_9STRA|nr:Pyridoxal kinase [Seminavis robusta]|eukprot:Sro483_g152120.1 Pyridoxal kinase (317) ;mRNA; r:52529-53479